MARAADAERELPTEFDAASKEFLNIKNQMDALKKRQDELKPVIISFLEENIEADGDGHRFLTFDDKVEGFVGFQRQRRVKRTVDVDAASLILDHAGLADECIQLVPQIDEDAVMSKLYSGQLSEEDIDLMFPQEITYALVPKKR
jgi:hypothetical protein